MAQFVKMLMTIRVAFFVCIFFQYTAMFGQVRYVKEPELKQRLQGKTSVAEVMPVVEEFYRNRRQPYENGRNGTYEDEYVHWKRWEQNMLSSAPGPFNANFDVNAEKMRFYNELEQGMHTMRASTPNWNFTGPSFSSYINPAAPGGLNGLGRCDRVAFHPTDPNTIYVGAPNGGLWRTTNNGVSWTCLTSYLPVAGVSGVVVSYADPNTIYILTGNGDNHFFTTTTPNAFSSAGVFKTTDGGINWVQLPMPWGTTPDGVGAFKIAQSPRFPNKLLVACSKGLFYSSTGGNTWSLRFSVSCHDVDFVPGTDTAYAAITGSSRLVLIRSQNGGFGWTNISFGPAPNTPIPSLPNRMSLAVSSTPVASNLEQVYLFCGPVTGAGTFNGLYKSSPLGYMILARNTPNLFDVNASGAGNFDQSGYDNSIAVHPTNSNILVTGGACIFQSIDGALNIGIGGFYDEWQAGGDLTKYVHGDIHDLAFNPLNNYLYAASDGGIYYSTDNGVTWANISPGLNTSMFYDIDNVEANQYTLLGGLQDNGNKYRSTSTSNFTHVSSFDGFYNSISPSNNLVGYLSSNQFFIKIPDLSAPAGISIAPVTAANQWAWRMNTDEVNGDYIYASNEGTDSLWVSNNGGSSWFRKVFANGNRAMVTCPTNLNRVYACGTTPIWNLPVTTLKRTDDAGATWTANLMGNPGLPSIADKAPTDVEVSRLNSNEVYMVYSGYTANEKVYYSNNAGAGWTNISSNLPNLSYHSLAIDAFNNVYLGSDFGVFIRLAGNSNWQYFSNNLPRVVIKDLHINHAAGIIYAATYGRGIWVTQLHGACENFYLFTGNQTGERQYEANVVWSNAQLDTMQGTKILYKVADSAKLLNNFIAKEGIIEFKATQSPCGTGMPVLRTATDTGKIDLARISLPRGQYTDFPLSTLRLQNNSIRIDALEEGEVKVMITDSSGRLLRTLMQKNMRKNESLNRDMDASGLQRGLYYVCLFHNGLLAHFQEYQVQ